MTRDRRRRKGGLSQIQASALQRRFDDAAKLPEHGETWLGHEIGLDGGAIRLFSQVGIIQKRGYEEDGAYAHYWETKQGVREWLESRIENRDTTPCGQATGIRTIEPGTYTCTCEGCDCRMDRETAEAVFA